MQTLSQPSALLDIRFHPAADKQDIFAVISSTGALAILRLDPVQSPARPIQHIATSSIEGWPEDDLFLQCQWHPSVDPLIGITTSSGRAMLVRLDEEWKIETSTELDIGNELEAWSIAFAPIPSESGFADHAVVYCGGDDSAIRYNTYQPCSEKASSGWLDKNSVFGAQGYSSPIEMARKHDAGVTAILPLNLHDAAGGRLVVTGSYDDRIRLFAIHDPQESAGMKRVKLLLEDDLGGGVWRLELVDISGQTEGAISLRILASCMYAGARLVELSKSADETEWKCQILARFEQHESMNYGSVVVPEDRKGGELSCISTSFYDKLLCLWRYQSR